MISEVKEAVKSRCEELLENLEWVFTPEMAMSRLDVKTEIRSIGKQVVEHLVKLLYWNDPINIDKHTKDIDTWLKDLNGLKLKPKNKSLSEKDYLEAIFLDYYVDDAAFDHNRWEVIMGHLKGYKELPSTNRSSYDVYLIVLNILTRASKDLSKGTFKSVTNYFNFRTQLRSE